MKLPEKRAYNTPFSELNTEKRLIFSIHFVFVFVCFAPVRVFISLAVGFNGGGSVNLGCYL